MTLHAEVIAHHLAIFGLLPEDPGCPLLLDRPGAKELAPAIAAAEGGRSVVAVCPHTDFLHCIGIASRSLSGDIPRVFEARAGIGKAWARVRTLHTTRIFEPSSEQHLDPIVVEPGGGIVWGSVRLGAGRLFLLGTDLGADLVRYRQGDPQAVLNRQTGAMWGYAGERPIYLFEKQLVGCHPHDRPADWWCWVLREALQRLGGVTPLAMLPDGVPGVVIVTGDDDQAALQDYDKQQQALGELPVTYFLHPLTKHDLSSLKAFSSGRVVEWGLHPDALEAPKRYFELFAEQHSWFERLTGYPPKTVRNHGFLNDGYWGHLPAWLKHQVEASSNLPGVDGRVLNGSLLPARLVHNGRLTDHWSVLTSIGDGIMFALSMGPFDAKACVCEAGRRIKESGVPGVLVLNLHPENIERTRCMHDAVHELVAEGFRPMTFSSLVDWFKRRHPLTDSRQSS